VDNAEPVTPNKSSDKQDTQNVREKRLKVDETGIKDIKKPVKTKGDKDKPDGAIAQRRIRTHAATRNQRATPTNDDEHGKNNRRGTRSP